MRDSQSFAAALILTAGAWPAMGGEVTVTWDSHFVDSDTVLISADVTFAGSDFYGFCSSIMYVVGDDDSFGQALNRDENAGLGRLFRFDGTSPGAVQGDDIVSIDQFQMMDLLNDDFDSAVTIENFYAFEYTITDFTQRTVTYTSVHENFTVYTDQLGSNTEYDWVAYGTSFTIGATVIPLPSAWAAGSVGLLALGMFRRRPE